MVRVVLPSGSSNLFISNFISGGDINVVIIITKIITENRVSSIAPNDFPTEAKIKPTSPLGTIETPTNNFSFKSPFAKIPAKTFPIMANKEIIIAITYSWGLRSEENSICNPV